jgi:hypothetical protein
LLGAMLEYFMSLLVFDEVYPVDIEGMGWSLPRQQLPNCGEGVLLVPVAFPVLALSLTAGGADLDFVLTLHSVGGTLINTIPDILIKTY